MITIDDPALGHIKPDGVRAFITGSHAYGAPRPDSDIDLVVLMHEEAREQLEEALDCETGPVRAGSLNLIVCDTWAEFRIWQRCTEQLIQVRDMTGTPVTREEAKTAIIKALSASGFRDRKVST